MVGGQLDWTILGRLSKLGDDSMAPPPTSSCAAITCQSPRMLPLQRVTLCFNVLETMNVFETMDTDEVQQQAVCTTHIHTLVVIKADVFDMFQKKCTSLTTNREQNPRPQV